MPSNHSLTRLYDIRDNITYAREFVQGIDFDDFAKDRLRLYAVTRALEIISEAACRLPKEIRNRHPQLPWRAIMACGILHRRDYGDMAADFIWRKLAWDLPR